MSFTTLHCLVTCCARRKFELLHRHLLYMSLDKKNVFSVSIFTNPHLAMRSVLIEEYVWCLIDPELGVLQNIHWLWGLFGPHYCSGPGVRFAAVQPSDVRTSKILVLSHFFLPNVKLLTIRKYLLVEKHINLAKAFRWISRLEHAIFLCLVLTPDRLSHHQDIRR